MEDLKIENQDIKWKIDFWSIFFAVLSLILFNLALFIPKQRIIMFGFFIISIMFAVFLFYINKINYNEKIIKIVSAKILKLSNELTERFNYLKEIYNLKVEIEMLKKQNKKAKIDLLDIIKIIVAVILIYVIIEVIKSLSG